MKTDEELRDYFAAHALAGLLAHPKLEMGAVFNNTALFTRNCYKLADSMLKARKEKTE